MKRINFRKAVELLGYKVVKYIRGYNYRSCFAVDGNNNMYYFNIEDLREQHPSIMYRTARDEKDYTGGTNTWDFETRLERLGYYVVEPRSRCDYNRM